MKQIKEQETYNLSTLIKYGLFPGTKNKGTAKRRIMLDLAKRKESILKTNIQGSGVRTTYLIQGKNLIAYQTNYNANRRNNQGAKKAR